MSARANAANRQVFMVLQMRVRVARASVQMHYTRSLHPAFYTCCWAGRQTLGVSIRRMECERKMRRVEERTGSADAAGRVCVSSRPASALFLQSLARGEM